MVVIINGPSKAQLLELALVTHGPFGFLVRIETDFGYSVEGYPFKIETNPSPWFEEAEGTFVKLVEEKYLQYRGGISERVCIERIISLEIIPNDTTKTHN